VDSENGTMTDRLTGFIWLKNWEVLSTSNVWATAMNNVAALQDNGSTLKDGSENGDWRMPNVRELTSIINLLSGR